jgi:tetratricopeptide (TPR) repeat protein
MQKDFNEFLNEGFDLLTKNEFDKANEIFNVLLNSTLHENKELQPNVLFQLGSVAMKRGHHALAIFLFRETIKQYPQFIEAINNLGYAYKQEQMVEDAKKQFSTLVELIDNPEYKEKIPDKDKADYITNLGSLYIANGTPQEAISYFDKALVLDKDNHIAKWNRSLANLEKGEYEKGFAEYDCGERTERCKDRIYSFDTNNKTPFWDGTRNQVVVVYGEQGIGDEIMFASMLPDIMRDC